MSDLAPVPAFDLTQVLHALKHQDVDGAIEAGLMQAPAFSALCGMGMSEQDAHLIDDTATQRRTAWAARERFHQRNARVAAQKHARENAHALKRDETTKLPPAANAALLRVLARARKSDT